MAKSSRSNPVSQTRSAKPGQVVAKGPGWLVEPRATIEHNHVRGESMSKSIRPPSFRKFDCPRVLVEATEWSNREMLSNRLAEEGFDVVTCAGPEGTDDRCPLVESGTCPSAESADVIVQSLRHSDPRNREVLLSLRRHYPSTPIVVEVPEPHVAAHRDDFDGCEIVAYPATLDEVVNAVHRSLAEFERSQ
jgi:hypothetical protein